MRASRASTASVVSAAGLWYALPVPTYTRPVAVSIAGVFHTAPPSWPGGTVYVFQRIAPVEAFRATTLPRTFTFGSFTSPYSAEVPMKTVDAESQRLRCFFA